MIDTSKVPENIKRSKEFKQKILDLQDSLRADGVELFVVDLNDRKFLQALRRIALEHLRYTPNILWKAAYEDIAKAADVLDAFWGRLETAVSVKETKDENPEVEEKK